MKSYDLTLAAEDDLREIWIYTYRTWGLDQADRYFDLIERCLDAVGDGRAASRSFDTLPDGIHIHRCEHHYIVWLDVARPVVIAILHERMDIVRHLDDRM
ncbi:type II toxin-antitoxin system RelE/ParE family toxin [Palleronia sp. LCG004]|uniref:type II toxin-antitoxin system RelE/ParE family toxin n=1 Tax=Palleronia sp. LCG004 TaxID=3079304 RepID=UPI002943622C|nr:type II toxin-antitoxin system RelE/ParE family toxin [Palleronia sp. LCG004]WOI58218.1 type II toxin-antitoxin system RelE/ParE family toxin [Palleronia sp. LCG004]